MTTSWEASDDASSWVFDLREDVTFHDGSPFGADDVIYSMTRHLGRREIARRGLTIDRVHPGDILLTFTHDTHRHSPME